MGRAASGHDTTLDRDDTIPFTSMRPGIHGFEGDEPYAVTWWDPARLDLDRQPTFGLRREELIAKDAAPGVVDAGLEAFRGWRVAARGGGGAGEPAVAPRRDRPRPRRPARRICQRC